MIVNHINLGVTEVPATVAMFETYFALRRATFYPPNDKMAFLTDDSGMLLSIFRVSDATYPKIFHIGFTQQTREQVRDIREQLKAGGFAPQEAREEQGRFTFYFTAPGGFMVEVNTLVPPRGAGTKE